MTTTSPAPPLLEPPDPDEAAAPLPVARAEVPMVERSHAPAAPRDTPRQLRVLSAVCVVMCLIFGGIAAIAAMSEASALEDAQANAEQLVRVQAIDTALVQADANATNAFLVGGVEPADQRQAYLDNIARASDTIAVASAASDMDAPTLGKVNQALAQYTGLIESARANNRQGFPVGVAYLKQASTLLRAQVIPLLGDLVTANDQRVTDANEVARRGSATMWLAAALTLLVLVGTQVWLLMLTHRVLNLGLVIATLAIVVAAVTTGTVMSWGEQRMADVRSGPYKATLALSRARIAAFDAKSNESLTLISRGSGKEFEDKYQARRDEANQLLVEAYKAKAGVAPQDSFKRYDAVHVEIRSRDDGGDWEQAVQLATTSDANGSNAAFATFDRDSQGALQTQAAQITEKLDGGVTPLQWAAYFSLVLGLMAAFACAIGMSKRIREYR